MAVAGSRIPQCPRYIRDVIRYEYAIAERTELPRRPTISRGVPCDNQIAEAQRQSNNARDVKCGKDIQRYGGANSSGEACAPNASPSPRQPAECRRMENIGTAGKQYAEKLKSKECAGAKARGVERPPPRSPRWRPPVVRPC